MLFFSKIWKVNSNCRRLIQSVCLTLVLIISFNFPYTTSKWFPTPTNIIIIWQFLMLKKNYRLMLIRWNSLWTVWAILYPFICHFTTLKSIFSSIWNLLQPVQMVGSFLSFVYSSVLYFQYWYIFSWSNN